MIEKKRILVIDTKARDVKEITPEIKQKVAKYLPYYIPDDNNEIREDCEELVHNLRTLLDEYNDDQHVQNYIIAKVAIQRDQCPFQGISDIYENFLKELKSKYKSLEFIDENRLTIYFCNKDFPTLRRICTSLNAQYTTPPEMLLAKKISPDQLFDSLKKIYNYYHGRIPKTEQVLLLFPEYLTRFFELKKSLFTEDGPLPTDWRYFIAILSVSCYGCEYLYNLLLEGFIEVGGNLDWLEKDSKTLPPKLALIINFNKELAYNPWVIYEDKTNHFQALTSCQHAWTRQEVLQMIVISSFYHSMCCLAFGLGVLPELDFPRDQQKDTYLKADDELWKTMTKNSPVQKKTTEDIIHQLRKLVEGHDMKKVEESKETLDMKETQEVLEVPGKQKKRLLSNSADETDELIFSFGEDLNSIGISLRSIGIFEKFFGPAPVHFESYPSHNRIVFSNVYEWKTLGYSFLHEILPEIASKIDAKYEYVNKMTLERFGDEENIDTSPFRRSIVYYLEIIHGYGHLDFDYKQMNLLLPKDLKLAIKTIGGMPQNFNFGILNKIPVDLKPYEICHIVLLIMESKFHLELMYGILALQSYEL